MSEPAHQTADRPIVIPWRRSLRGRAMTLMRRITSRDAVTEGTPVATDVNGFLVLRAYACLLVVVLHVFGSLGPTAWPDVLHLGPINLTWLLHTPAWAGVWIFFTLSGYLMGKAFFSRRYELNREGVCAFYHNRAWRIAPLYFLVVAVSCLFETPIVFERAHWGTLARMLTCTYAAQGNVNPNGALWSISTEVQFYLLAPGMAFLAIRGLQNAGRRRALLVGVSIAALATCGLCLRAGVWRFVCQYDIRQWSTYIYKPIWMNLDLFGLGLLMNLLTAPRAEQSCDLAKARRRTIASAVVLVAFNIALGYATWTGFTLGRFPTGLRLFVVVAPTCTALFTCATIVSIEQWHRVRKAHARAAAIHCANAASWQRATVVHPAGPAGDVADAPPTSVGAWRPIATMLCAAPLRFVEHAGHLTYGIYVWHALILQMAAVQLFPGATLGIYCQRLAFVALFVVLLAELTYRFVELPAESRKQFARSADEPAVTRSAA